MTAAVLKLWPGGTYAGVVAGSHLIAGPLMAESADWEAATEWARGLSISGCTDFVLPTRGELTHLHKWFPRLLLGGPYWTCEPVPGGLDVWVAHFALPHPLTPWGRIYPCHAIVVRRVPHSETPT